jgi:hypothetical protein
LAQAEQVALERDRYAVIDQIEEADVMRCFAETGRFRSRLAQLVERDNGQSR